MLVSAPASILLLHGEEDFLIGERFREVLSGWRRELVTDFGLEELDSLQVDTARLAAAVAQGPFLDPYRVVVVRGLNPRRADPVAAALVDVPATTRVLISATGKVRADSRLVKAVRGAGGKVEEFAHLKPRELPAWIAQRARRLGLPPIAASALARAAIPDLGVIASELDKLAGYHLAGYPLDQPALDQLLVGGREDGIFQLTDSLLPRPGADAQEILASLLRQESPTGIAYRLARHLSLVLEVASRRERGQSLDDIKAAVHQHPFVVEKAYRAAQTTTPARLEKGLEELLTYEWRVKSGQIDGEWGLIATLSRL